MRAGGGCIYFQYHRIHSDCAFERHRSELWQTGNGSGHDDYGVCMDCCAPIAAADADDEKHRTAQIIADAVCTVCAVSRAVVLFLELQHPFGQPYRNCADTRGLLVNYGFFGGTACPRRQNQSGFGLAQYGYGFSDGFGHSAGARGRAILRLAAQLPADRGLCCRRNAGVGQKPACFTQPKYRLFKQPAEFVQTPQPDVALCHDGVDYYGTLHGIQLYRAFCVASWRI